MSDWKSRIEDSNIMDSDKIGYQDSVTLFRNTSDMPDGLMEVNFHDAVLMSKERHQGLQNKLDRCRKAIAAYDKAGVNASAVYVVHEVKEALSDE